MSKDKNNALGDNELEAVSGGVNEANAYYNDLKNIQGFDDKFTESKAWDCDLLLVMQKKYSDDEIADLMKAYSNPAEMFR